MLTSLPHAVPNLLRSMVGVVCLWFLPLLVPAASLPAVSLPANPILSGADPHVVTVGKEVWMYPTWTDGGGQRFFAFSSTNLMEWQRHGPVLDLAEVSWIKEDGQSRHFAWAPSLLPHGGRYYLYYAVGPQNPTPSRIGVAVGDAPQGPFRDSGRPLLTGGDGFEAIDPMAFTDPASGRTYLYAGGSAGATLRVFQLQPNLVGIEREVPVQTPPHFTEAPFVHVNQGRYYLSYSHGSWQRASYSVHYATADSPFGPWTYQGVLLQSDTHRKGPGHHSFFRHPHSHEWLIAYHRWENQTGDGPYRGARRICLERVHLDLSGRLLPITMTGGASEHQPTPDPR